MTKDRLRWIISGLDWDRLTPWEERFVEDVEDDFNRTGDLTKKQEDTLERIYAEKSR